MDGQSIASSGSGRPPPVPNNVSARTRPSPAVSEMTTPSTNSLHRHRVLADDVRWLEDLPKIAGLALPDEECISPVKRIGGDEELECDLQAHREHPGAKDLEIECDDDDDALEAYAKAVADRLLHEEEEDAAKLDTFVGVVASYQAAIRLQVEAKIVVKKEEDEEANVVAIPGAPVGWKPPTAPDDWQPAKVRANTGEPHVPFGDVDNPGGWSRYTFRPKCKSNNRKKIKEGIETEDEPDGAPTEKAKFMCYAMPTGVTPVPLDATTNKRTSADFELHYNG